MLERIKSLFRKKTFSERGAKMIAHRGFSALETENSLPAFRAAAAASFWGIETDVHVTADGRFLVFHDDNAARLTGADLLIETASSEELRALSLPDKSGKNAPEDRLIPFLRDYLSICRDGEKTPVLELKNPFRESEIDSLLAEAESVMPPEAIVYISFSRENCLVLRRRLPGAAIQFLSSQEFDPALIPFLAENRFDLDLLHRRFDPAAVPLLHEAGILLNCWTVDDAARARALLRAGADFITTNALE